MRIEAVVAVATEGGSQKGSHVQYLKSQAFRALLALSALTASGLVLEAGRRWAL